MIVIIYTKPNHSKTLFSIFASQKTHRGQTELNNKEQLQCTWFEVIVAAEFDVFCWILLFSHQICMLTLHYGLGKSLAPVLHPSCSRCASTNSKRTQVLKKNFWGTRHLAQNRLVLTIGENENKWEQMRTIGLERWPDPTSQIQSWKR